MSNPTLRELRAKRGWSLADLAYLTKLNRSTISRIERGVMVPKPETVLVIANALGIRPARVEKALENGKP